MTQVYVEGIALRAPGLDGWAASRAVLRGERPYSAGAFELPPVELLPPNERRRMVKTVKLALVTAIEAFTMAGRDPRDTATVFTSSGGDGETLNNILATLDGSPLEVSPTRFHNSVHNAPSGYWAIATSARAPSTSLCAHDVSFTAGLLDAVAQAATCNEPVGLIAYDLHYPEPLHAKRPIPFPLGVALLMAPERTAKSIAALTVHLDHEPSPVCRMEDRQLEALRIGTPSARSLPLLAALARERETSVVLEHIGSAAVRVAVSPVAPCS